MSTLPSISVVIALYNKAPFVQATVDSVLAQQAPVHEIIVVDDGSTDGGAELVEQIGHPRLRLIRQANSGVSRARNAGIQAATGEWIAFLDADDLWHPLYLAQMVEIMRGDAKVVASSYRSVEPHKAIFTGDDLTPPPSGLELISNLPDRWRQGTCFFTSSVVVRRELLQSLQPCFPPGEHHGEDLDLWFRLAEHCTIHLDPRPLVLRLWVPGSLTSAERALSEAPFLLRMEARAHRHETPAALRAPTLRFVDDARVTLARTLISRGIRLPAWHLLSRGWRHATRHRWALSLLMLVVPRQAVHQFQAWRTRRRMIL